ncbi:copper resistance protein B [Cognatilysobacter bugurensis]|uniref:Copper resistance protein B n=1 Tax=Cognatilysobacter bugurensis TaxID=543356 RepID=A0A918SZ00_9GAMM|nr:copper resistance protein B [Lysobacter bugurensis]GHA80149.1 copper resistance protein B [Lysobacter bugurensis]
MSVRTVTLASSIAVALACAGVSTPAHAQHAHGADKAPTPQSADHSKMDHSKMDHSKMDHSKMDHSKMDHSKMDHSKMDHSKMDHSKMDHSKMDHSKMDHSTHSDHPPPTGLPVITDADRAAAFPDIEVHTAHDNRVVHMVQFNRLEAWSDDGEPGQAWEGHAWIGNDLHKLRLRSEGEREHGRTESADLEVLYGRAVAPWWDVVAGVRHDFQPGGAQTFAALGVAGLAPYKFEVEATAYLGESGQTAARVEAEYETLLTNRLIAQSLVEATAYGRDDPRRGIGAGLSTLEAGVRLRYEITRRFAPYVGIAWERAYGETADLRRDEGEPIEDARLVMGVRFWF